MFSRVLLTTLIAASAVAAQTPTPTASQPREVNVMQTARRPLSPAEINAIATIEMLEDTRKYDEYELSHFVRALHPEVRRRAILAIGRIGDPGGNGLLRLYELRNDADPEVRATVVFSTGQLKDPKMIPWLSTVLSTPTTPPAIAREAARALGKYQLLQQPPPEARAALAQYLLKAPLAASPAVVGEALLSYGRFGGRDSDIAPIVRWIKSTSVEVRWRAAWALFRPRNMAAIPHLLTLSRDLSPEVRYWAVRGLVPPTSPARGGGAPPPADAATSTFDPVTTSARLRESMKDTDRRVRTEAIRALGFHDDDASFAIVLAGLDSADSWISVSAAEGLGRFASRKDVVAPKLIAATAATKPVALRITAMQSLVRVAPEAAVEAAAALAVDANGTARNAARQALNRDLGDPGKARLAALAANPSAQTPPAPPQTEPVARTLADYAAIVKQWVVPDYNGAPKPRAILETPRGAIEVELYAGDAPLGLVEFVRLVESGAIVGTEFSRVVPNFVDQQMTVPGAMRLRDEVNRRGLTRANLSWASSGLDTGRPGYTLGHTPQPHNEGNFTSLGRVVAGFDAMDRIELGDKITGARMKK